MNTKQTDPIFGLNNGPVYKLEKQYGRKVQILELNKLNYDEVISDKNIPGWLNICGEMINIVIVYKNRYWSVHHRKLTTNIPKLRRFLNKVYSDKLKTGSNHDKMIGEFNSLFPVTNNFIGRINGEYFNGYGDFQLSDLRFFIVFGQGSDMKNITWQAAVEFMHLYSELKWVDQIQLIQKAFIYERNLVSNLLMKTELSKEAKCVLKRPIGGYLFNYDFFPMTHKSIYRPLMKATSLIKVDGKTKFFENPHGFNHYNQHLWSNEQIDKSEVLYGIKPHRVNVTRRLNTKILNDVHDHWVIKTMNILSPKQKRECYLSEVFK